MRNLFDAALGAMAILPVLAGALGRLPLVDVLDAHDIGAVAAVFLEDRSAFIGRRLDPVGDRVGVAQMIVLLDRAGHPRARVGVGIPAVGRCLGARPGVRRPAALAA